MRISIFGLGYVGAVTAGCLANRGYRILGVDTNLQKVDEVDRGVSPIVEPGLAELMARARSNGLLAATASCEEAVAATDASIVCVGTPSTNSGGLDLSHVRNVVGQLARAIEAKRTPHHLVLRSTMLPGSTESLVARQLAGLVASGKTRVVYYPEFLREGSAVADFEDPSLTVVGTGDGRPPEDPSLLGLFGDGAAVVEWRTAEIIKYGSNAFHAAKIVFANEMGRICKELGTDAQEVMAILCRDVRLNLSPYYLRPGNPFGGSCLPKDVRALVQHGRERGLSLPLLESLLPSNTQHLQELLGAIVRSGTKQIVILGLSFKPQTDDLRNSPMVEVAETLLGRGYTVRIFDPQLNLSRIVGSNRRVMEERMPHLASLLRDDLREAIGEEGLILVAQPCVGVEELAAALTPRHRVLDVNGWPELRSLSAPYEGFCW